jgi:hypothetical protein
MDQTARISLQKPAISKSERQKLTDCALPIERCPPQCVSVFLFAARSFASQRRLVWLSVGTSAPPVKAYLRMGPGGCKVFFTER